MDGDDAALDDMLWVGEGGVLRWLSDAKVTTLEICDPPPELLE